MAIECDADQFVDLEEWILVKYKAYTGKQNLSWVKIKDKDDDEYVLYEVDSVYFEGDLEDDSFRYIGGDRCKKYLLRDEKIRKTDDLEMVGLKTCSEERLFAE